MVLQIQYKKSMDDLIVNAYNEWVAGDLQLIYHTPPDIKQMHHLGGDFLWHDVTDE